MDKAIVLRELREIEARISAVIRQLDAENVNFDTTVGEIRRVAILEEIFRTNGVSLPEDISNYAIKYGKTPSSCAGYFSGKLPSLVTSNDRVLRVLTETGKRYVEEAREKWGEDWLERVPLEIVGNCHTPSSTEINFIS